MKQTNNKPWPTLYAPAFSLPGHSTPEDQWKHRHNTAVEHPARGFEQSLVSMLRGFGDYARTHAARYESDMADDGVLGPAVLDIALGLRTLLNGETGRLDCGTLDGFILNTLDKAGYETDIL